MPKATVVKMKIRTATMSTDLTGGISDAMDQLLISSGGPEQRLAAIEKLKATHDRMVLWEQDRDTKKTDAAKQPAIPSNDDLAREAGKPE